MIKDELYVDIYHLHHKIVQIFQNSVKFPTSKSQKQNPKSTHSNMKLKAIG